MAPSYCAAASLPPFAMPLRLRFVLVPASSLRRATALLTNPTIPPLDRADPPTPRLAVLGRRRPRHAGAHACHGYAQEPGVRRTHSRAQRAARARGEVRASAGHVKNHQPTAFLPSCWDAQRNVRGCGIRETCTCAWLSPAPRACAASLRLLPLCILASSLLLRPPLFDPQEHPHHA